MKLSEQFRQSVGYLMTDISENKKDRTGDPDGFGSARQVGTVFFIRPEDKGEQPGSTLAVTARHCVRMARQKCQNGFDHVLLRVTDETDGPRDFPVALDGWTEHPTEDVAVARVELDVPKRLVAISQLEYKVALLPGLGCEVYTTGCFQRAPGRFAPEPVIHVGRVALLNGTFDMDIDGDGKQQEREGHLITCLLWGGFSGAPVFFADDDAVSDEGMNLLGLVQGGFNIRRELSYVDIAKQRTVAESEEEQVQHQDENGLAPTSTGITLYIPSGISKIVPAKKILECVKLLNGHTGL